MLKMYAFGPGLITRHLHTPPRFSNRLLAPEKYFSEMQQSGLAKDQIEQICGLNAMRLFNSGGFYE